MSTRTPRTYASSYEDGHTRWRSGGWGPVLSGAAASFLTFITFSALWLAIAALGVEWVGNNIAWFEFATALVAAPVGGAVAGWLQPGDPASAGFRGFAAWGLVLFAGLIVGVPATAAIFRGASNLALQGATGGGTVSGQLSQVATELWAVFCIFGAGGLMAALAGSTSSRRSERGDRDEGDEHVELRDEETTPTRTEREPVTAGDRR